MRREYSAGIIVYRKRGSEYRFLFLIKEDGEYDVPKGHIEKGESSESAAIRETNEETGLSVKLLPHFSTQTSYFFRQGNETVFKKVRFFISRAGSLKVGVSREHKGYAWLSYSEALRKLKHEDLKDVIGRANSYVERYEAMERLNEGYVKVPMAFKAWGLSKRLVRGEGPLNAGIMLIGQAPGRFEDKRLRPFVGRSGMLLDSMLKSVGMKRESLYITSVVQFFPPKNRLPSREEVNACLPFLRRQVEIIKPGIIVLMGNVASGAVSGISNVQKNHGRVVERAGARCLITFHPAAALRFGYVKKLMEKDLMLLSTLVAGYPKRPDARLKRADSLAHRKQ